MRNPFKWQKVQFEDGLFGYRRWCVFFYAYLDLINQRFWWTRESAYFLTDCRGIERVADKAYQELLLLRQRNQDKSTKRKDPGRPV